MTRRRRAKRASLPVIEASEERTLHRYHRATSYQNTEGEGRPQRPRIGPGEADAEVHYALLASVMVRGPV